jgi:hypothetical protein
LLTLCTTVHIPRDTVTSMMFRMLTTDGNPLIYEELPLMPDSKARVGAAEFVAPARINLLGEHTDRRLRDANGDSIHYGR